MSLPSEAGPWRLNAPAWHRGAIVVNGTPHEVPVKEVGQGAQRRFEITAGERTVIASGRLRGNELYADIDGHRQTVRVVAEGANFTLFGANGSLEFSLARPDLGGEGEQPAADAAAAPMVGTVVRLLAEPGARVEAGQALLVLEAMKMEYTVCATAAGVLRDYRVSEGAQVGVGDRLFDFDAEE